MDKWLIIYNRIISRGHKPRSKCSNKRESSDNKWLNLNYKKYLNNQLSLEQSNLFNKFPKNWFEAIPYIDRISNIKSQIVSNIDNTEINSKTKLQIKCNCGKINIVNVRSLVRRWEHEINYRCKSCDVKQYSHDSKKLAKYKQSMRKHYNSNEYKQKCSKNAKKLWSNNEFENQRNNIKQSVSIDNKINPAKVIGLKKALKAFLKTDYKNHMNTMREKAHKTIKELWKNQEFKKSMTEELIKRAHNGGDVFKKLYNTDQEFKQKVIANNIININKAILKYKELCANPEFIKLLSDNTKLVWNDKHSIFNSKEYREKLSANLKLRWMDIQYRDKILNTLKQSRVNQPRCSSIQSILYSILDDLNIKYYREYEDKPADSETIIGPYSFDCVIPRDGKSLLIECQGDYWHSLDKTVKNDQSKASYITNNFSDKYELKYLWEHEFKCKDKIVELIKYWMGITQTELVDFNFKDIVIKKAETKDYKLLLSKYHYLLNAGRGGIACGAYLNDKLIGVCVFSPLIRQNINIDGYKQEEVRELSRLCVHPRYQKHNFASWFVSRCVKQLDTKYKCIISYTDITFNHDGAVYKACNFVQDSIIKPDYWYINEDKWVMHKKTLYNHAVKMKMTEAEFAAKYNYTKIYGKEKLRFIYKR